MFLRLIPGAYISIPETLFAYKHLGHFLGALQVTTIIVVSVPPLVSFMTNIVPR